jgi:CheY-like chemotaxis protein
VLASPGLYSRAPQYQHRPPLFIQRYFRLSFGEVKVNSISVRLSLSFCFVRVPCSVLRVCSTYYGVMMDLEMPGVDGITTTRRTQKPRPMQR